MRMMGEGGVRVRWGRIFMRVGNKFRGVRYNTVGVGKAN
jgi:hypothetical protein